VTGRATPYRVRHAATGLVAPMQRHGENLICDWPEGTWDQIATACLDERVYVLWWFWQARWAGR
jgi:hypothetical protein